MGWVGMPCRRCLQEAQVGGLPQSMPACLDAPPPPPPPVQKRMRLAHLPPMLCLHLKRFKYMEVSAALQGRAVQGGMGGWGKEGSAG